MYQRIWKRMFDILFASILLLVLSPVLILTACCILLEDGRPVLFRQRRIGKNEHEFTILKFRSMPLGTASVPSMLYTDQRFTRVGRLIRRWSIDELPQLLNVLRGDMSIVGPRPALPAQEELRRRRRDTAVTTVRPGLTGLAQVRSYDAMPETEKVLHDAEYAADVTAWRDLKILCMTATYLLRPPPTY